MNGKVKKFPEHNSVLWTLMCGFTGSNVLYCSTGVFQVLCVQYLNYHGIDGAHTGLGVLASYLGLLLFSLPFMFDVKDRRPRFHWMFIPTAMADVFGQISGQLSQHLCGASLFMIIYSSITVFAALFRWYFYQHPVSKGEWAGILVRSVGLCITTVGGQDGDDDEKDKKRGNASATSKILSDESNRTSSSTSTTTISSSNNTSTSSSNNSSTQLPVVGCIWIRG